MPPKKAAPAAAKAPGPGGEQDDARELMETELLMSFLRSKLGRRGSPRHNGRNRALGKQRVKSGVDWT
jgi:hypothetical protein